MSKELRKKGLRFFFTHVHAATRRSPTSSEMRTASTCSKMSGSLVFSHLIGRIDAIGAVLVVQLSLLVIRQSSIRFGDFLEIGGSFWVVWIFVWMPLENQYKKEKSQRAIRQNLHEYTTHSSVSLATSQRAHDRSVRTLTASFRYAFFSSASEALRGTPNTS